MKTKKTLAFALVFTMVFSLFCALPSVSAEETEDGTPSAASVTPAYETFNGEIYTEKGSAYSMANNSNLEGMKYFYFYVKADGYEGPRVGIKETGNGGKYFLSTNASTEIKAVKTDGKPTSWKAGGANRLNFDGEHINFEGYVILDIEKNLYAGWTDSNNDGLTLTEIDFIDFDDMFSAKAIGDFGFARSYADAVNAVSGKLNKYYDTEKVAPLSTYSKSFDTINEQEVPLYQNTDGSYTDKKWVGFRVSAENYFGFNFALVENNGAWWWINKDTSKSYYYLTDDGVCTEYSNYENNGFNTYALSVSNGFKTDGWIIFNTEELISDTHPGYNGNNDSSLSLDDLKSVKLFSVGGSDAFNAKPEYSIGDIALATDKDSLVEYFLSESTANALTLSPFENIGAKGYKVAVDNKKLENAGFIGFYVEAGTDLENTTFLFWETSVGGGGAYWTKSGTKTIAVSTDGKITNISNTGNGNFTLPGGFKGYLLIDLGSLESHPSYKETDTVPGFDVGELDWMNVVNGSESMKLKYLSVATDGNALLAHLKAEVEGNLTDNVDIINTEVKSRILSKTTDENEKDQETVNKENNAEISVKAYDYFEDSTAEMKYVGFRFKTEGNYGNIKIGFVEENGAMYWRGEKATYYFVKTDGTLQEGNTRSDSAKNYSQAIYSEGAFDGYVIIPLSSLVNHPGHKDDNDKFDIASLAEVRHFGLGNTNIEIGDFAFGTDMADLLDYLVNADKTQLSIYGDANGDGTLDILDLIRMKKYFADDTTEIRENAFDMNRDGEKNVLDLTALRKYLILGK